MQINCQTKIELIKLNKQYDFEDSVLIINEMSEICKDKGLYIRQVWQYYGGDAVKTIEFLEQLKNSYSTLDMGLKYIANKYTEAKRKFVSGRSVFNPRITETPIKDLIKAIKDDKLDEFLEYVLPIN